MRLARKQAFGHSVIACLILLGSTVALASPDHGADDERTVVLKNATVHSQGSQGTFVGSLVITGDKISELGTDVKIPADAEVIDLSGCHVVPGLIASRGKLWLTPAALAETNTKAELNVVDAIDPWAEDWKELASQGITTVYVQPNSTSSLGGYGSALRVGPFGASNEIVLKKEIAVQASVGTRGTTSKDRYSQVKALEKLLESAKEKKPKEKKKTDEQSKEKSGESKEKVKDDQEKDKPKPKKESDTKEEDKDDEKDKEEDDEKDKPVDPTKVVLRRVLSREIPLFVEVHHSDSLRQVIELAKKFKIRVVLDGLSQVNGESSKLLKLDYPAVVGPFHESAATPAYRKNAKFDWLPKLSESGQLWALSSFSSTARGSRMLRIQAAHAIALGADKEAVLAAMTVNAARILGISDQVGTLEKGKTADLAVFAGDPMNPSAATRLVMNHGKVTFENAQAVSPAAKASKTEMDASQVALPTRLPATYTVRSSRMLRDGKFEVGTMTIADGKIVSVEKPDSDSDVPIFDLGDAVVSPGLVMASSTLGQDSTIIDATESDASHLRSVDAIDPANKLARRALAGGFIHVGVSPGASNTSAGVAGHIRLGATDYVADPDIASQFVLSDSARKDDRFPSSLNGQVQLLNDLFAGKPSPSSVYVTAGIGQLIAKEKLANVKAVVDGSRIAILSADSKLEMRSALALAKKHDLHAVLLSKGRFGEFAGAMADQDMGLIVNAIGGDEYDTQIKQILDVQQSGAGIAFAGDSPEKIRITAALLASAGMEPTAVLSGLTEGGGKLVGMKNVGLAKGAPADFVVWSDSPIDLSAKPLAVVVDGQSATEK